MSSPHHRFEDVTLGLLNGQTKVGRIKDFDPRATELSLVLPAKDDSGSISEVSMTFSAKDLSYIGFHKAAEKDTGSDDKALREYCVHVSGEAKFVVCALPDDIDEGSGFVGYPMSRYSWFGRIFFYAHGVHAVEDVAPFGSLLVDSGLVRLEDLEEGLEQQAALRNARIGEILVEQEGVSRQTIEQAAEAQNQQPSGASTEQADAQEMAAMRDGRLKLGQVLVEAGLATQAQIDSALAEQRRRQDMRLGEVLIELGLVSEQDISKTLAAKFNLDFVDLDTVDIDPQALSEVPGDIIERFRVFPIHTSDEQLTLAMSDPLAMEALDLLRFSVGKKICEVVAPPSQINRFLNPYLDKQHRSRRASELEGLLEELHADVDEQVRSEHNDVTVAGEEEGAVARLVNQIIIDAYRQGASDIHIEPNGADHSVLVRFRIDGICETYRQLPAAHRAPLVARIKIMSNLDITERRKPQDGKIKFQLGDQKIELRVATVPTVNRDEDVVLRLLAGGEPLPLDQLSLSEQSLQQLRRAVKTPYGLILAVGPTGSGKTTTLHALLGSINTVERKIWTAEDPVEISQNGLRQVQVHPKIGFGFSEALRSFLRADPDVIMVGEMRDPETATIGIEASLTGHLVFSTLHTNSAPETITRLIDMGLDPFSFSDALIAILAQRLARRLCPACRTRREANEEEYLELVELYGEDALEERLDGEELVLWQANGCQLCEHKGYKGRVGIHELLVSNEAVRGAIQRRETVDSIRQLAREHGMKTLVEDGVEKCLDGITDLRQVLAVCSR